MIDFSYTVLRNLRRSPAACVYALNAFAVPCILLASCEAFPVRALTYAQVDIYVLLVYHPRGNSGLTTHSEWGGGGGGGGVLIM